MGYKSNNNYLCAYMVIGQDDTDLNVITVREYDSFRGNANTLKAAFIIEALTVRIEMEDVRSAVHWLRDKTSYVEELTETFINTCASPTRDICNVLVFTILNSLDLVFEFRIVGLVVAVHLNGMSGRVLKRHKASCERFEVCLKNGKSLCVRPENLARIQGSFNRIPY
jgi:hypothetical protein